MKEKEIRRKKRKRGIKPEKNQIAAVSTRREETLSSDRERGMSCT